MCQFAELGRSSLTPLVLQGSIAIGVLIRNTECCVQDLGRHNLDGPSDVAQASGDLNRYSSV